jgi:hypothetical protein
LRIDAMPLDRADPPCPHATRTRRRARLAARCAALALAAGLAACIQAEPVPCQDADGDGYGADNDPACLFAGTDCDDGNPWVNPGAQEICGNAKDDDCSGGDLLCPEPRCEDADSDGYGEGPLCRGPDCDDTDSRVHPGAGEICGDGIDNDCYDGDRDCPPSCIDGDHDGYGDGVGCLGADCNDAEPAVNPGADEICEDGVDNDCYGGDEECLPRCGDGWLSLGVVRGTDMGLEGDYASPDPDQGEPWILLSPNVAPGSIGKAWIGFAYDAALDDCVTEVSVFTYAFDDSFVGTGANVAFDTGDGSEGDRIANIDSDETWYGNSMPPAGHVFCDVHTCVFWIVITAGALDYTHVREVEAAIYLDRF